MPDESYVTPEQFAKDQKEYEDVLDDIFNKSDEELAEAEAAKAKEADGASGDANKDQSPEAKPAEPKDAPAPTQEADPTKSDTGMQADGTNWKAKAEELEAELKRERQRTGSWDGRIKAANKKVADLEAENEALRQQVEAKATDTASNEEQSEQEVMDAFRETFPELTEVVDILEKRIKKFQPAAAPAKEKPEPKDDHDEDPKPAPVDDTTAQSEHYLKLVKAHPDIDELVRSGALITWINTQPEYIQPYLNSVVSKGTTDQVINTVKEFKTKTGWKSSISVGDYGKQKKLQSMMETDGQSPGPKTDGPDRNDFAGAAKEAGL